MEGKIYMTPNGVLNDDLGFGAGDSALRGLGCLLVAKFKKVESVEASGEETKSSRANDHLYSRKSRDGEDREAKNGCISAGSVHGMQPGEEKLVIRKQTSLSGVLESLMSLDSKGDFMGPLDGLSSSNLSKVAEAPMCLRMMQEKIRTHQYSTLCMFVNDFERICYNALRCNQKRSIIWAAAHNLLRRGKKQLEQYEGYGESLVAWNQTDSKISVPVETKSENEEAKVCHPEKSLVSKGVKMAICSATTDSVESNLPSSGGGSKCKIALVGKGSCLTPSLKSEKRENQMSEIAEPFQCPTMGADSEDTSTHKDSPKANASRVIWSGEISRRASEGKPANGSSAVGQTDKDVDVEGERDVDSAKWRWDAEGDATESSSSYGSSGSSLGSEVSPDRAQWMFEAESSLRDGNGAVGLIEDDYGVFTGERGFRVGTVKREKKVLDAEWKQTRRGIEWRCHWLELKTLAIQAKLAQYEKVLKKAQGEKVWKWNGEVGEELCSRTVPVKILRNHPIVHHKHRRRAEGGHDVDLGKHPVFSRYEKRKTQRNSDSGSGLRKVDRGEVQQTEFEVSEPESTYEREDVELQPGAENAFEGQDSMEQLLWQVEALQVRVRKQKHLLRKEAAARKNISVGCKDGSALSLSPHALPQSPQKGNASTQALPCPKGVTRAGPLSSSSGSLGRSGSGAGLARRKTADYDISNMVMPANVGTTFVEQIRHVDIETPLWRVAEDANPAVQHLEASSSDEETEDEHYQSRHSVMETLEKLQRYMPRPKKSVGDIHTVGKGKLKVGSGKSAVQMGGKGSSAGSALPSGPSGTLARSADNIPKRQRSNRSVVRRPLASLANASAAQTKSTEGMKSEPVKSEVSRKAGGVDLLLVGNWNTAFSGAE
nr:uncharacterized protein LOC112295188 isoform X4 [Physcomitrium patens]XP_024402203.1 uncharacterized protein LOC112295188 isoform X4 [Physcomitrium patens]|eukprot:XP_024402202.1 uncharacterized protein LOC112295188 isoform X4 [Physcomitrella patens]